MKTKDRCSFRSRPQNAAFNLVELLVVVVIVAMLAALPLAATSTTKDQVKIAQCASNLRQFGQTMHILASENGDRFPNNNSGFWPWDVPWAMGEALTNYGPSWKVFYCPGTAPRFDDADNFALFNYSPPGYRVFGYALTLPGTPILSITNVNSSLMPPTVQNAPATRASTRVLLADATISAPGQNNFNLRYSYNWTQIQTGFPQTYLTAHMRGPIPAGGNLSMLDGHVEWRPFDKMAPRTVNGSSPVFWW